MRSTYPRRLFASFYVALAVYCGLSVIAGPAGIIAYRGLAAKRDAMKANLETLGGTNASLQAELDALSKDSGRASREARALGFLQPGEVALVVQGDTQERGGERNQPGFVLRAEAPIPLADASIKHIALMAGLAALLAGLAGDLGEKLKRPPRHGFAHQQRGQF